MNPKTYLNQYDLYRAELKNKRAERKAIEYEEALPSGVDYSKDRVQSSHTDGMFSLYLRIQMRCEELNSRILWLEDRMRAIEDEVNSMNDASIKRLLHMRYIEMQGWHEVSEELARLYPQFNYSEEHIRGKLHQKALREFAAKNLSKETKDYTQIH